MNVLVVEDHPESRYFLEQLLPANGYAVQSAGDGVEALERLASASIDLIISDILMPRMDGFALCRAVKGDARYRHIPFVFYTATYTDPRDEVFALSLGASRFIVKPMDPEGFIAVLREVLAAGAAHALPCAPPLERDEPSYYKAYNARLIQKLEEKMTELERSEARYRDLVENANDLIYTHDRAGRITSLNRVAVELLGYGTAEASGAVLADLVAARPAEALRRLLAENARGQPASGEIEVRTRDGRWLHLEIRSRPIVERGDITGGQGIARDVTERKRHEARIHHLAYYDAVTGLPNRALFLDRLGQVLLQQRRHRKRVAVALLGLDRFMAMNDTVGHSLGDEVLREVAARVRGQLRGEDTLARLGGDEFLLLLPELRVETDAAYVVQKVLSVFSAPFRAGGQELRLTASVGVSLFPKDGADPDTLVKHADAAMARSKEAGRNGYQFFAPEMTARASKRLGLEVALRQALEHGGLTLHYQPQVELPGLRVTGVEALLRWPHPERGWISPAEIIPVAEESGLIVPVGEWALRTAFAQHRVWLDAGLPPVRVSVNLSPRQLRHRTLLPVVREVLADFRCDPRFVDLEITESSLMDDPQSAIEQLLELRALGIRISMDDFGVGYSSLAQLKRLPLDRLKIDQSFVRDLPGDADAAAIVQAIVALGRQLKLGVVGEGVETAAQLEFLQAQGCMEVQGYWFSRPLPPEGVPALLSGPTPAGPPSKPEAPNGLAAVIADGDR